MHAEEMVALTELGKILKKTQIDSENCRIIVLQETQEDKIPYREAKTRHPATNRIFSALQLLTMRYGKMTFLYAL